jgi:hypothetical protein
MADGFRIQSLERRARELAEAQERGAAVLDECAGPSVVSRCMANIEAKPIRWLWPGKIARGKVFMLAGNPGLGKSQVTVSMAAIVSTGGQWPVDRTRCERGSVIILSAEDDAADTIKPRLMAAGADLSRVHMLDAVIDVDNCGEPTMRGFNLRTDLARLGDLMNKMGDVAMVVIDPITAYLGDTDSHKNAEVRALLAPLGELAARYGTAMVCVSHLNKGGGNSEALMRVTGSLAFVAAARGTFVVARDPDDNNRRLFLPLKNNIGKDESGLAFRIETRQACDNIETSCVSWEVEAVTVTADEALMSEERADNRSELDEAVGWLRERLAGGPLSANEIKAEAGQAGMAWATVRRAKNVLGVRPTKTRFDGGWEWALPSKVLKSVEDAQAKCVSTFGKVEHLRGQPEAGHVRCTDCWAWADSRCSEGQTVSDPGAERLCGRYAVRGAP